MASGVYLEKPIQVDNWNNYIMLGIGDLFRSKELCDLTLRFPSRDLKAHSVVLHSCSSFFTSLLKGKTIGHKIVKMPPQIDADAMAALLSFIYTGRLQCALDLSVLHATARVVKLNVLVTLLEAQMLSNRSGFHGDDGPNLSSVYSVTTDPQSHGRQWNRLKSTSSSGSRPNSRHDRPRVYKSHKMSKPKFVDPPAVLRPSRFEYPADLPIIHLPSPSALDTGDTCSETALLVPSVPSTVRAASEPGLASIDCRIGDCSLPTAVAPSSFALKVEATPSSRRTGTKHSLSPSHPTPILNSSGGGVMKMENVAAEVEVCSSGATAGRRSTPAHDSTATRKTTSIQQPLLECSLCAEQSFIVPPRFISAPDMPLHLESEHNKTLLPPECRQCSVSPSTGSGDSNDGTKSQSTSVSKSSSSAPHVFNSVLDYIKHVEDMHIVTESSGVGVTAGASPQNTCSVCGYGASTWLNLSYHRYTRHRIAPPVYVHFPRCDRCEFEAISSTQLDNHLERRHRVLRRYRCRQCPPSAAHFDTPSQLEGHRRTCHGTSAASRRENVWKCQQCGLAFSRSYNLKAHTRSVHRTTTSTPAAAVGGVPGVCVLAESGRVSAIGKEQTAQLLSSDQLATLRYSAGALYPAQTEVVTEISHEPTMSQPVSLLNAISAVELAQHLQQQGHHQLETQPMSCEFILSTGVASAGENGDGGSGGGGSSVIPVQDVNGLVSYIALQPATTGLGTGATELAAGPDGSALLEISQLPPPTVTTTQTASGDHQLSEECHVRLHHHQQQQQQTEIYRMPASVQPCDSALILSDSVAMTTTVASSESSDASVPVVMATGDVTTTTCGMAQVHGSLLAGCGPMSCIQNSCASLVGPDRSEYDALPAASTIEQTISAQQLSTNGRCFIDSHAQRPSDAADDWSQMMPSVLMVTNESQPRV